MTSPSLFSIAGQFLIVAAIAFVVVCLVTSYMRFQALAQTAARAPASRKSAVSPFSGLIAERMSKPRAEGRALALLVVSPNEFFHLTVDHKTALAEEMVAFVENRLRQLVRARDRVAVCEPGLVGILMDTPAYAMHTIAGRLSDALKREPMRVAHGITLDVSVRLGWTTTEQTGAAQALLDQAKASLEEGIRSAPANYPSLQTHHDGGQAVGQHHLLDPMTGVLKQESVSGSLQKYVALHFQDDLPMSMLYVDVDHLKRYNEQYGRETGDRIIKAVSSFLQRNTREEDLIGRCGVDEFVVAASAKTQEALGVARRLLAQVKKAGELNIGEGLKCTVSIGVAGHPEHGSTAKQLFEAAQSAMLSVKRRGRNNIALMDATPAPAPAAVPKKRADPRDVF